MQIKTTRHHYMPTRQAKMGEVGCGGHYQCLQRCKAIRSHLHGLWESNLGHFRKLASYLLKPNSSNV